MIILQMGSAKPIEPIGEIEKIVGREIRANCTILRMDLRNLQNQLAFQFPETYHSTQIPNLNLQLAVTNEYERLAEQRGFEKIRDSEVLPTKKHPDALLVPNFIVYLSQFGTVGLSSKYDYSRGGRSAGIFLRNEKDEPELLGLLNIISSPLQINFPSQIQYFGYVPTNLSESDFHFGPLSENSKKSTETLNRSVWHLCDSPPKIEGVNVVFVRLFAEREGDKFKRYDAYDDKYRDIKFP